MNKVITINLNGNAYPLEENGYEALRTYLDTAARRLAGNPDQAEIIADIEQAIADKFRAVLSANKTVVVTAEVEQIIAEMGPVEDATGPAPEPPPAAAPGPAGAESGPAPKAAETGGTAKRLYRIKDGAMIAGVCNGFAAYFNLDVTLVRVLFAVLAVLTWGVVAIPLYLILVFLLPTAHTSAEKAAAHGAPSTAEEFIRRAREGYYQGMKTFHDKRAHRQWKRQFKQEMRGWKRSFRQEMRNHAQHWSQTWHHAWAPQPRPHILAWVLLPIISLALFIMGLAAAIAFLSLLCTGALFGVLLPHGIPLWIGLVFIIVAYHVVAWPLKSTRYFLFYHGTGGFGRPYGGGGSLAWLVFLVLLVWVADRHVPEFHQALYNLPPMIHQAVDSVRQWWDQR